MGLSLQRILQCHLHKGLNLALVQSMVTYAPWYRTDPSGPFNGSWHVTDPHLCLEKALHARVNLGPGNEINMPQQSSPCFPIISSHSLSLPVAPLLILIRVLSKAFFQFLCALSRTANPPPSPLERSWEEPLKLQVACATGNECPPISGASQVGEAQIAVTHWSISMSVFGLPKWPCITEIEMNRLSATKEASWKRTCNSSQFISIHAIFLVHGKSSVNTSFAASVVRSSLQISAKMQAQKGHLHCDLE